MPVFPVVGGGRPVPEGPAQPHSYFVALELVLKAPGPLSCKVGKGMSDAVQVIGRKTTRRKCLVLVIL